MTETEFLCWQQERFLNLSTQKFFSFADTKIFKNLLCTLFVAVGVTTSFIYAFRNYNSVLADRRPGWFPSSSRLERRRLDRPEMLLRRSHELQLPCFLVLLDDNSSCSHSGRFLRAHL